MIDKLTGYKIQRLDEFLSTNCSNSGYYNDIKEIVNQLFVSLSNILVRVYEVDIFFDKLKDIISLINFESEATPLGFEHNYNIEDLIEKAKNSNNLNEFFSKIFTKNEDKEFYFFTKYYPPKENLPTHSNECEDLRAFLNFKNIQELKELCIKIGLNYEKLLKENCFYTIIEGVNVFVNLSLEPANRKGYIQLQVFDSENPYLITSQSIMNAKKIDSLLKTKLI